MEQAVGTAWVVATGALTNVALLFATFPELVQHIKGMSIMGGAIGGGFTDAPVGFVKGEGERFGNHTRFAEFNIYVSEIVIHEQESDAGRLTLRFSATLKLPKRYSPTQSWPQRRP